MRLPRRPRRPWRIAAVGRGAALLAIATLMLFPLLWMAGTSLRPNTEAFRYASVLSWHSFVPEVWTLQNYAKVLSGALPLAMWNSFWVAMVTVALSVLANSLAAFALAMFEFPGRRTAFGLVILSFLMPFEAIVLPLHAVVKAIGLHDSLWALIVTDIGNGVIIFVFVQFFRGLPRELIEAARIDGAGWLRIYAHIAMPLSLPTVAAAALVVFVHQWEAFFWPLVVLSSPENVVAQLAIARSAAAEANDWGAMFAGTTLVTLCAILPFLVLQRHYVASVAGAGLK
jgi:ABC-type glycerol-3-phosphate transport system permease component